jgi:MFS family permease
MALSIKSIARSLKHRNYRLFFTGQLVSVIGTWITSVATSWLIYRLTNSTLLLASLNAAGMIPSVIFAPFAGVQSDRWDRRKVLLVTQSLSMLQSFTLAALTLTSMITVNYLFFLVIFQGIVNAFDVPTRQALLSDVVESKRDLPNAIALNSALFHGARLIGPAIGGLIIALTSEGYCFLIDGFSYLAVLIALNKITSKPAEPKQHRPMFQDLKEGLSYAVKFEPVGAMILLVAAASFSITPNMVLLPAFAREVFGGGPETLGLLMASSGLGALCGALYLASRESVLGLAKVITAGGFSLGCGLLSFAFTSNIYAAIFFLFVIGLTMILVAASSNTVLQTIVRSNIRGRILSLFTVAFTGMIPVGSLTAGIMSNHLGIKYTAASGGLVIITAIAIFTRRLPSIKSKVRPIYEELGII